MTVTPDAFRALARSSPWRWTTLHLTHRDGQGEVEAWVRRPGRLLVRDASGEEHRVDDDPRGPASRSFAFAGTGMPERYRDAPGASYRPADDPSDRLHPQDVVPRLRPDGLVAERPHDPRIEYDDPMWGNYSWVAMLDPVELSHHVVVDDPREDAVHGRPAWRARLGAEPGYDPRCGGNCCELLWSEEGLRYDFPDLVDVPEEWRGRDYPAAYDVALDVQTGVVVRCHPVGGAADSPWLEADVHEVDADLAHLFAG